MYSSKDVLNYYYEHGTLKGCPFNPLELNVLDEIDLDIATSACWEEECEDKKLRNEYLKWWRPLKNYDFYRALEMAGFDYKAEENKDAIEILQQMRMLADKLRKNNISNDVLQLGLFPYAQFTPIEITSDYKIIFPNLGDWDNDNEGSNSMKKAKRVYGRYEGNEINFEPLEKLLYIISLNHPEGINPKNLTSYKDEIKLIYHKIIIQSNKDNKNTINELSEENGRILYQLLKKDSEGIRSDVFTTINNKVKYFLSVYSEHQFLLNYYTINTEKKIKKILLDRRYVIRHDDLMTEQVLNIKNKENLISSINKTIENGKNKQAERDCSSKK